MSDDEYECLDPSPDRIKALGFKPQKEIAINHLLPYADELDEESTRLFSQIKTNLAKAVLLREMKPACGVWSARLMKYLRIYGLKFSKEDHIALIKMVYELLLIPELEPSKIHKFSTLFVMLTKKRFLISPEELTLPWRPLYDMGLKIFDKSRTHIGMYHYLTSLESSYITCVKCARPYFPVTATREILAECLPQIAPWLSESHLMAQMTIFLPVSLAPAHAKHGHELWFDQFMTLWDTCNNSSCGISDLMLLFASLTKRNPGAVDWTPHVPKMFSRFMHAINFPVSYKDMQYTRSHTLETKHIATWIVWTISPTSATLRHLRSFLSGVESYLHSANAGRWSFRLRELLRNLSKEFLNRVRRERDKKYKNSWENHSPESHRLRDEDITEFVQILVEPTLLAVHSRSGSVDVATALQNLATLRPAIVVPPLLERLRTSLESLTEPHRVTAAMTAVAAVARPMLRGAEAGYPEGPTHVVPLLMGALPGLDPNDIKKTLITLHFILIFSWMVPYIDCSSATEHWTDLTEEEILTCESTAGFEDFVLLFLERVFRIVESSILENVRHETKESDNLRSKAESVIETALSSAATSVLMQCSPKIFAEALRKFKSFAINTTFETNVAGSIIGVMLRVFARIDSEATLAAFIPQICDELDELLSTDETLHEETAPRDLLYRLLLLSHAVECDGKVLLKYMPRITNVLDRALKLHAKESIIRACDVLGHVIASLGIVELKEFRSCNKDYSTAPKEWLPIREWGRGCPIKEAKFTWHVPDKEEVECAQYLLDRYGKPELERLEQWISGERDMCKKRRLRCLFIINALTCSSTLLPPPDEPPVQLVKSQVPATNFPLASGVKYRLTLNGGNIRVELTKLLMRVQARMVEEKSDDTRGFEMLIQVWERISGVRPSRSGPSVEVRMRSYAALERALEGRGGPAPCYKIRSLLADAVRLQDESRIDMQSEAGIGQTSVNILLSLYQLSVYTYTSVRILAQVRLYWMLSHYAYSYRALIPHLTELLSTGGEGDEWHARHKGALYVMLGPRAGPLVAKQDWGIVRTFWPAILKAPLSEKPSILRLEHAFSETLHRQFPAVNTWLEFPESCLDSVRCFLTESELNDPQFKVQMSKAIEMERMTSERNIRMYNELLEELVAIATAPNVQWRRLELVMQMLTYCPSLQTPYTPNTVNFIVNSLIHENISVRRTAIRLTHFALKQRKHRVKKITVSPYELAGVEKSDKTVPGYRKEIEWAIWSESRSSLSEEDWDKPWLRKSSVGFYSWPDKLEVAAPSKDQVSLDRPPSTMEEGERHIFEFFSNDENVDKLVSFLTVEDKKGKDKFSGSKFSMFRVLFRCFGPTIGNKFLAHALKHAADTQEAPQRFAAEIVAASIRAPRYWDRDTANKFYDYAMEVLKAGLKSVTAETMEDWGTCVASAVENLDPHRGSRVLDALDKLCVAESDKDCDTPASFLVCARLYALQGALGSMMWRVAPLAAKILRKLDNAQFLQHPYQNVRENVGSMLMTIFDMELVFPGGSPGLAPQIAQFIDSIKPKLAVLYDEDGEIVIKPSSCASLSGGVAPPPLLERERPVRPPAPPVAVPCLASHEPGTLDQSEEPPGPSSAGVSGGGGGRADKPQVRHAPPPAAVAGDAAPHMHYHAAAVNLLTTVLRACMGIIVRGVNGATVAQYALMRTACALSARGPPQPHDELGRAADGFLASLAMTHHHEQAFDVAIETIENVATSKSWWARLACVEFAQPLLFYGLPMMCAKPDRAVRAENFALKLMKDSRIEVRQAAAKLLTGLMHCQALPDEDKTIKHLIKASRSKDIIERHCGVLGLCGYLSSRPYSLGPKIGLVLAELSRHTNAPDPVPAAIRKALADFRRTHHDDWPKHREALTEEELDLLSDLTAPPSYCA